MDDDCLLYLLCSRAILSRPQGAIDHMTSGAVNRRCWHRLGGEASELTQSNAKNWVVLKVGWRLSPSLLGINLPAAFFSFSANDTCMYSGPTNCLRIHSACVQY
jgi:hypothetical protein